MKDDAERAREIGIQVAAELPDGTPPSLYIATAGGASRGAMIAFAQQPEGWRPIKTAPKDGTVVDLWKVAPDGIHGRRVPDALWDDNRSFNGGIGRVAQPDAWVHAGHRGMIHLDGGRFSHWMPPPTPPAAMLDVASIPDPKP